jgi:hypothetical protein
VYITDLIFASPKYPWPWYWGGAPGMHCAMTLSVENSEGIRSCLRRRLPALEYEPICDFGCELILSAAVIEVV